MLLETYTGGAHVTLDNCTLTANESTYAAGALANTRQNHIININNSFITNNVAPQIAAIFFRGDEVITISNTTIANNADDDTLYFFAPVSVVIDNCIFDNDPLLVDDCGSFKISNTIFRNNLSPGNGALRLRQTTTTIENTLFHDNSASTGGAIYLSNTDDTTLDIIGCTFTRNTASINDRGEVIFVLNNTPTPTLNITNSILWDNDDGDGLDDEISFSAPGFVENYNHSLITGIDLTGSNGLDGTNPANDPLFTNPGANDFTLQMGSPVIELGDNTVVTEIVDLAGNTRIFDGDGDGTATVDFGVYESLLATDCSVFTTNIAYVDINAIGANDGSSWADAFTDLQDAITAINDCLALDTMYVAEGSYFPSIPAGREATFQIPADAFTYGGFSPSNGAIDLATRDFRTYLSILDGDLDVPGVNTDNARTIVKITADALIDGLTIRNAYSDDVNGSGLTISGTMPVTITNCTFNDNHGIAGGAIKAESELLISNSIFYNNLALLSGGAIDFGFGDSNETFTIDNSLFYNNTSNSWGGALAMSSSIAGVVNITNTTFTKNTAGTSGDAILKFNSANPESLTLNITNTIIWDNDDDATDDELVLLGFTNENFSFSLIKGLDLTPSNGLDGTDLANDPLFTNPATNDFTLQATSPVIDLGDDTAVTQPLDLAGNPRNFDGNGDTIATVDYGAYESQVIAVSNILVNATTGDLEFIDNDDRDDDLTIAINATDFYRLTDPVNALIAGPGAIQIDPNTVDILIASVTGTINIETLGGDDTFTTDFSFGNMTDIINYNGGNQNNTNPGDILRLQGGGTFATVEHTFISESDGNVMITGTSAISYVGLEPIIDNLSVTDRIFSFTGADETIILENEATSGSNSMDSTLGESVTFTNPSNSLTINTKVSGGSGLNFY